MSSQTQRILAIDPGTAESALVMWHDRKIVFAEIVANEIAANKIHIAGAGVKVACEMVACYGMPVGREVFETCLWIGEFRQIRKSYGLGFDLIYRRDVKLHHCGSARAKDSNVIQALKDKYGDKGTKNNPGVTYGLKSHLWQAFAIATMITETSKREML